MYDKRKEKKAIAAYGVTTGVIIIIDTDLVQYDSLDVIYKDRLVK